jgi:hypothetical protein
VQTWSAEHHGFVASQTTAPHCTPLFADGGKFSGSGSGEGAAGGPGKTSGSEEGAGAGVVSGAEAGAGEGDSNPDFLAINQKSNTTKTSTTNKEGLNLIFIYSSILFIIGRYL